MEAPKEYGKISIGLENRVIPEDKLENTPSRKHGVSEELERDLRVVGCEYIQSAGLLLKLPQVNISAIFNIGSLSDFGSTLYRLPWPLPRCCFKDFITLSLL